MPFHAVPVLFWDVGSSLDCCCTPGKWNLKTRDCQDCSLQNGWLSRKICLSMRFLYYSGTGRCWLRHRLLPGS